MNDAMQLMSVLAKRVERVIRFFVPGLAFILLLLASAMPAPSDGESVKGSSNQAASAPSATIDAASSKPAVGNGDSDKKGWRWVDLNHVNWIMTHWWTILLLVGPVLYVVYRQMATVIDYIMDWCKEIFCRIVSVEAESIEKQYPEHDSCRDYMNSKFAHAHAGLMIGLMTSAFTWFSTPGDSLIGASPYWFGLSGIIFSAWCLLNQIILHRIQWHLDNSHQSDKSKS
jgi:hypothetical protein